MGGDGSIMSEPHHFRIILNHDRPFGQNMIGLPIQLPIKPSHDSYIVYDDKIIGYEERQRALNFYNAVHKIGGVTAITVSPNFE
jgi:hypothetical protein